MKGIDLWEGKKTHTTTMLPFWHEYPESLQLGTARGDIRNLLFLIPIALIGWFVAGRMPNILEARVRIELTHKGFADLSLTTWVPRRASSTLTE